MFTGQLSLCNIVQRLNMQTTLLVKVSIRWPLQIVFFSFLQLFASVLHVVGLTVIYQTRRKHSDKTVA